MANEAHTKGPWRVAEFGKRVVTPDNETVALAYSAGDARLIAAAPELYEALEPFADVDGEGDEDFPDDTKVTVSFGRTTNYTLTLGDFRRARAALKEKNDGKE